MRREDNFLNLAKAKKIVIPIIQRDYAQGRNNAKAIVVRTRLIDEWIDILRNKNLRMDFNYIYGSEKNDEFYPVDGQQRLTSLYLLHWYLAQALDKSEDIHKLQFDYKTRNSASEFFAFLRDPIKSKELFKILNMESSCEDKQSKIRNNNWFKTKWDNDPTITSCVNFLCMLAIKLSKDQNQFSSFWDRLCNSDCSAVYFTCLSEIDNQYAEIDAAKKYTRMNARGKRLTDFENLKAMIDEIEMKHIKELMYCYSENDSNQEDNTISWTYDRKYIDCFYKSSQENSLMEKTKAINDECESWFRLIYYVYALVYGQDIPCDLLTTNNNCNESYEDVIYKISQERAIDDNIVDYLYMIKALFEIICNDDDKINFVYEDFDIKDSIKRRNAIAFILFMSGLWKKNNKKIHNINLIDKWEKFKDVLLDLNYAEWQIDGEKELALIIHKIVHGIKNNASNCVDEYFIINDFNNNSPFENKEVLPDIKCRLIERKVKSKLIADNIVTQESINKVYIGKRRFGYIFYICDLLDNWNLDELDLKRVEKNLYISDYIKLISENGTMEHLFNSRISKVIYAFSSQYDTEKKNLYSADIINNCNNEHIWHDSFIMWQDDEFGCLNQNKIIQLNHFKEMLNLLIENVNSKEISFDKAFIDYIEEIKTFFNKSHGYEKCWLRLAVEYEKGGNELLISELENDNGEVKINGIPVILKVYLIENGYSYTDKINRLKDFNNKFTFFTTDDEKVQYSYANQTCTFPPDSDNSGKYQHSQKTALGWDLSGNTVSRNMDLFYRFYLDLSFIGTKIRNNFWSVDISNGIYTIKVYEVGSLNKGKVSIIIREASLDRNILINADNNIIEWTDRFNIILKSPIDVGNYDKWIELWNNDYDTAFGNTKDLNGVIYDTKGGQRPRKIWSNTQSVPVLSWIKNVVDF